MTPIRSPSSYQPIDRKRSVAPVHTNEPTRQQVALRSPLGSAVRNMSAVKTLAMRNSDAWSENAHFKTEEDTFQPDGTTDPLRLQVSH